MNFTSRIQYFPVKHSCLYNKFLYFNCVILPRDLEPAKAAKTSKKQNKTKQTNKQTHGSAHLPKSAASLSNNVSAKFQDGVTDLNFINSPDLSKKRTDRSEIEKNFDLPKNRVTSKESFTGIRFAENYDSSYSMLPKSDTRTMIRCHLKWHLN